MDAYVDFKFYSEVFGGKLSSKDFSLYEFKARKFIDKITFNRINEKNINDDIKMAVCIAIEKIKKSDSERGFKLSETVGKHSVSYSESLLRRFESSLYKEISIYIPSELLYRGCDY
ncbi:MAG: hypothetical protein E6469_13300 [Clostridium perfringens]|uniref:hypothetical protein n=1 Tax=Clostridium perfringens TaxID=1502 RepID=UPI001A280330|nr:hypothetical protein [Clostridium perfringens]MDU3995158.1 hypothetical protein [Enterobacter sp.]EJT5928960.1 hypothetical protein [Clostridium perfringens]EJT5929828.1 hypothetical protein [Clostridium perfringens]EJT6161092.1 hypothetical protein [Clostridium perfringens]EJT6483694.1 hypothetical protein [Clostridium perfringens]